MTIELFHVDAFADRPFAGNPAAVCLMDDAAESALTTDTRWMQRVAAEMNLSETAFITPAIGAGNSRGFNLRWFTPGAEVQLCGHATLASAHALWQTQRVAPDYPIVFHTASGPLNCALDDDGWITMNFPAQQASECPPPHALIDALNLHVHNSSIEERNILFIGNNKMDYLVQVANERIVRNLRPDFDRLRAVEARGVIVTAHSTSGEFDFISRFFAPAVGVYEDPVTGSAHCCLAPFWAQRLGKSQMLGYQASPRGGFVRVRLSPQCPNRVDLIGKAITITRGELVSR